MLVVEKSGVDRLVLLAHADALTAEAVAIVTTGRKVTCFELLDLWAKDTLGRWSKGTTSLYRTHISALFDFAFCWKKPLSSVTREELDEFVNAGFVKYQTRKVRLSSLRSLYRWARARNHVLEDLPATLFIRRDELTFEQLEDKKVQPLTEEEFRRILGADIPDFWKQVTALAYWTGLRFSDCVALEWASVGPDFLTVWTKKRGKRVALPLDDPLLGAGELRAVLAAIPRIDPIYCFPRERMECLSGRRSKYPMAFERILTKLAILDKSFHSTRHSAITRFSNGNKNILEIAKLVGHSNDKTTSIYIHA